MNKFLSFVAASVIATSAFATQIKELANIVGVRDNQLIGYGLVVGLNGTGDGSTSKFTENKREKWLQIF